MLDMPLLKTVLIVLIVILPVLVLAGRLISSHVINKQKRLMIGQTTTVTETFTAGPGVFGATFGTINFGGPSFPALCATNSIIPVAGSLVKVTAYRYGKFIVEPVTLY